MPDISGNENFPLQNGGSGGLFVRMNDTSIIKHDVMFESGVSRMPDAQMYVGRGFSERRLLAAFAVPLAALGVLFGRAAWMQIVQGAAYRARADENRFRVDVLPARRGLIRDRNGVVLAENIPSFDVRMRWSDLPLSYDPETEKSECKDLCTATVSTVADAIGTSPENIFSILNATGTDPDEWVNIARDISYERAVSLEVKLPNLSGVSLITSAKRTYPHSAETPSLSHVLGYVGSISPDEYAAKKQDGYRRTDEIGRTGVERTYESAIRGAPGIRRTEVDAHGRPRAVVEERNPTDGGDVTLAIDAHLQEVAETALIRELGRAKATRGSVVVMDANDGSILTLVSWPAFDNNAFAGSVSGTVYKALIENPDHPLFSRAVSGQFPSGSTIKPVVATAALAEGIVTPHTTVNSVGGLNVGPWFFPDWKAGGHGITDVRRAIAWSVNTFFYEVGGGFGNFRGLGIAKLTEWMRRFGLGAETGVDLPGETDGFVPSESWKEEVKKEQWYIGDTYNLSIGQGDLLVTPIQMARITAAVANGGTLVTPHVVLGAKTDPTKINVSPDVLSTVRLGMRDAVTYGSARALSTVPIPVAGKTGTAQWREDQPTHAWFIGFAPFDHPQIVVTVMLESGGEGSSFAVPVAGDILRAWAASGTRSGD